jgi:heme-degrading monooxygenase HmoA
MAEILEGSRVVTQITTVKLTPDKQDEVINLMIERARFMATQPGFVSIALHRSKDGSHVVNYVQWRDAESLAVPQEVAAIRKNCRRD